MTLHFLNDVANDTESTQKSKIPRETSGKLINRITGLRRTRLGFENAC